jgi:hypothetical protein
MRYGATAQFDYPQTPFFTDVPVNGFGFAWIQRMKVDNITGGCSQTQYCPNNPVSRQDMSLFIMKGGFNYNLSGVEPILTSVSPASLSSGQLTTVTVTGVGTHFAQLSTVVAPIPGVTIGAVTVLNATTLTVDLTPAAAEAPQSILVTTGAEEAVLPNALTIPQ